MNRLLAHAPMWLTLTLATAMLIYGPIAQPAGYHDFADARVLGGIPRAGDVLSNLGFALVGVWGLVVLGMRQAHSVFRGAWPGYALFLVALIGTTFGSGFYHLAPDNQRLVWDRIPIALACAGLLAGVHAETRSAARAGQFTAAIAILALASVLWWYFTESHGRGDLRPYLLLQVLPALVIPLWQAAARAPRADRLAFGAAIVLYILARAAELNDSAIYQAWGFISGHTLKHLLATGAAVAIVARLVMRGSDLTPAEPLPCVPRSSGTARVRDGVRS